MKYKVNFKQPISLLSLALLVALQASSQLSAAQMNDKAPTEELSQSALRGALTSLSGTLNNWTLGLVPRMAQEAGAGGSADNNELLAIDFDYRSAPIILNAAYGDALGRVTEFIETTDAIKAEYGTQGLTSLSHKKYDLKKGVAYYTDDTVMAKIVLEEAIKAKKSGNPENLLEQCAIRFGELFGPDKKKIDPHYDIRAHGPTNIGNCNLYMLNKRTPKANWWLRGDSKEYDKTMDPDVRREGGCGSVMRVWPIGLLFNDDLELVIRLADEQSKITHRNPMARAACAAMAVGTALATRGESVENICQKMIQTAEGFDAIESRYKLNAKKITDPKDFDQPNLIKEDKLLTSDMIRYGYLMAQKGESAKNIMGKIDDRLHSHRSDSNALLGWAADESVAAAVYCFVRNPNNIQAALAMGANTPGDSDSIATLAGALVGAHSSQVLSDYTLLENQEELKKLASQVHELITAPSAPKAE